MSNLPKNDEEYFELFKRIVNGAEYLEHPLINQSDKAKGEKPYDELVERATKYRR